MRQHRAAWACAALAACAVLVYVRSFDVPFVFDDVDAILRNRNVRRLWPLSVAASAPQDLPVAGRPLVSLSLALNYALGGYRVAGYHAFNLLVHVVNALLFFAIARRIGPARPDGRGATGFAFCVALLWSVHPLASEAVVYVIQRTELLVSGFALAAIHATLRGFDPVGRRAMWHAVAVAACACAALCKENAVAVPLLVLLADRAHASGSFRAAVSRHPWLHAGCFASWAIVAQSVLSGARSRSVGSDLGVSALDYLATQAGVLLWYLRACILPTGLSISHDWPIVASAGEAWLPMAILAALLAAALLATARRPALGLPALGPFLLLAPSSSVVPIVTEVAAERRMYLPLAGVIVLLALALRAVARRVRCAPWVLPVGTGTVALALAAATFARVAVWTDPVALWTDAVQANPANATAHNNLAKALETAGRLDEALAGYARAVALDPDDPVGRNNYGNLLAQTGALDGAVEQLEQARRLDPGFAGPPTGLGNVASLRGDWPRAIEWYEQALAITSSHHVILVNLAWALEQAGRLDEARTHLEAARDLEPELADTHHALGLHLARRREWSAAAEALERAVRLAPQHAEWRAQLEATRQRAR
jgi:tetratricopeptide (TPR) repeat protein